MRLPVRRIRQPSHRLAEVGALIFVSATLAGCGTTTRTVTVIDTPSTTTTTPTTPTTPATVASPPRSHHTTAVPTTPASSHAVAKTVVIDPGHNGGNATHAGVINQLVDAGRGQRKPCNTTGTATASGYPEAAFNFSVALELRRLLQRDGINVVMTRASNDGVGPCVNQRAAIGNQTHADAVIAIHADGAPPAGRGFHVIYPPDYGGTAAIYSTSLGLAHDVHDAIVAAHLLPESTYLGHNGYDQRSDLAGLNLSQRPAIFVELGNMDNPIDAALQTTPSFRSAIASALYRGLTRFLGAG
jgi:N-acetylmuramoyl-L-alanine amidase